MKSNPNSPRWLLKTPDHPKGVVFCERVSRSKFICQWHQYDIYLDTGDERGDLYVLTENPRPGRAYNYALFLNLTMKGDDDVPNTPLLMCGLYKVKEDFKTETT